MIMETLTLSDANFFETRSINGSLRILPANCLSFDELYDHYSKVGFLYQKKLDRLSPHLDLIRENWEKGWAAGRELIWTLTYREIKNNTMGTVTTWRTTNDGWQAQHLTSQNNPAGVIFLLLAAQDEGLEMNYNSAQNWYSPTNKFAMRIYGGMVNMVGEENAFSCLLNYLEIDPGKLPGRDPSIRIVECTDRETDEILEMAERCRGKIYCEGEELASGDIGLTALDCLYRQYGLGRKRYIWLAKDRSGTDTLGMIIVYRGPFGFNFSFLENRCDLLIDPGIDPRLVEATAGALLRTAADAFFCDASAPEYPIEHLVVVAEEQATEALSRLGAVKSRQYHQGIWLRQGFNTWKQYMERVFDRAIQRLDRQNRKLKKALDILDGK